MEFINSISPITSSYSIPVVTHFIKWFWQYISSIAFCIHFEP